MDSRRLYICIPVYIKESFSYRGRKVLIRFPLPYRVGEFRYPGSAEEKLRCEVATYIWIHRNCPAVPTPCLWGFGFPGGQSVCASKGTEDYPASRTSANLVHIVHHSPKRVLLCPTRMAFSTNSIISVQVPTPFSICSPRTPPRPGDWISGYRLRGRW